MTQEYSRACLRVAVAQMCQHLGWNSIHTTPLELLTDVLERYLVQLGKVSHRYSEQFGRTYGRMEDVLMAFTHMGVEVHELQDYVNHVDALPFAKDVVSFPAPQENDLKFPNPDSKEVQQRKVFEYIPEYLPYMHPELNEEPEDTNQSARPSSPERLQIEQPQVVEMSPTAGEKRPVSSPGDGSVPFKRQRLTTSQPLPEEASQSQYEMTSVVMTHSGILSPIREGKVPDSKPPPAGFKQIVIVRPRQKSKTPAEGSVVKLDIVKDASKGSKIVEVGDGQSGRSEFDRRDPDYKPKSKQKLKEMKRLEKLQAKPFKVKRGPGRPRSPARAAVVHNKGASGFSRIQAISSVGEAENSTAANLEAPIDLTMKPTPPMPNISVVKVGDNSEEKDSKILDYRPKNTSLSKQQEKDYEDTIDSVIGKKATDSSFEPREPSRDHFSSVTKEKKSNKDEWRVSHISETYDGEENDDRDDDHDTVKAADSFQRPDTGIPYPYTKPPATIAPHLKFLFPSASPTTTISPSRPRGRPRGSGSGFYKNSAQRSPMGGRRGRPPLHRGSPGRPPLSSVGRPSLNRSPGRPPLNRSPGRPPLNRSPGRPSTGRSPGRPKGSGLSPRPRGRPRGSKSPRNRGASPRGGSPRAAIANLTFNEEEANDSNDSKKTNIFKLDNDDSEATLFEFPSKSSPQSESRKEKSPTPMAPGSPSDERSLSIPSPAPTEPAGSTGSPDISPIMSPSSDHSLSSKRDPTPEMITSIKSEPDLIEQSYLARELIKDVKPAELERRMHAEVKEKSHRESSERERSDKDISRERDRGHREHKEHNRDRDRERDRDSHRERDKEIHRERDKDTHKERDKDTHRERDKDSYRERDKDSHKDRDKEIHREREKDTHKERDKDTHRERDKDSHRERDKDRDRARDKDRDRERSKEHRKDKKKKKKKNKERDKDKERTDEKDRKERHKERKEERREREKEKDKEVKKEVKKEIKKEVREESPSIQPLQKLKIKFGGSSSSPSSFSISTSQTAASPKPETSSPAQRLEIPKLKFKMLPPKPDRVDESDQSWVSSIKKEPSSSTNSPSMHDSSASRSPSHRVDIDSDSDNASTDHEHDSKASKAVDDEVTVSVVKGKIMVKKPAKRNKRKGSGKKGRPKGEGYRKEGSGMLFGEGGEGPVAALKKEVDKEASPISPPFSPQNVPSPITIPALKAAPPPPSPPAASKKISPPKPRPGFKDVKPESPLLKDITKARPSPVQMPKPSKLTKSLTKKSPKKSPKVSPTSKRKGNMSPTNKDFPFMDFQAPKTPSPRRSSSPSPSAPSSPMYSPSSSPERVSPLNFQIPATPAFPTRSPPPSPLSRQLSTDEDDTDLTPASRDQPIMPPPSLPPMPPTSAQRRAQRTVITETVGSFVNESGEKIWICPACTMQDDGSPMIGCDICDDWYHWVCVGIKVEPSEDEQWYCQKCKPNGTKAKGSKRGRKKRKS